MVDLHVSSETCAPVDGVATELAHASTHWTESVFGGGFVGTWGAGDAGEAENLP